MKPKDILREMSQVSVWLTRCSLTDSYSSPLTDVGSGRFVIGFNSDTKLSVCLDKSLSYNEIFSVLNKHQAYNFKMLDGALLQMSYTFTNDELIKHRLAFFPSPDHTPFQNDPELYQEDVLYADMISKNIVPFPVRFDYDKKLEGVPDHPLSHLTLGQYEGCRIPVTAPLTPAQFVGFILKSFYNKALCAIDNPFPAPNGAFGNTIRDAESKSFHFCLG